MNESKIFKAAAAMPTDQRAEYLDQVCGDNQQLRNDIESLLKADHPCDSFLERPAIGNPCGLNRTDEYPSISEGPGTVIGHYRLMEPIGEGGFGLVFVAEQQEPVRRKVALKIIKPGMDTKEVVARFEAERQALALMDHPNIAKVLDAGTTDSGRPYFVMELIRGIPIVEYCDHQELTTGERLKLFISVCRAVQHAHAKGIIHRDLKPSNILVSPHDGIPVVKVIDFGIAKAIGQQLTDRTIYTRLTQMIGTPLYMSPEQAEINALDVDIRSDVYSLGVLLYELLTGTTPFDRERFSKAAYEEIKRIIREEEPPTPSKRLSTLGDTLPSLSKKRRTEPGRLTASLRGEVDWIVMCCLEKDRSRRYQTAAELAADVERYLANEAVAVVPPSRLYKAKKAMRRHRVSIAISVGYVVVSLIGLATTLDRAKEAKDQAAEANRQADLSRGQAQQIHESNQRLESTLAKLKSYVIEKTLSAALSGNEAAFSEAVLDLKTVPESETDVLRVQALHNLFSGNAEAATKDLSSLLDKDPEDVALWAIKVIASHDVAMDLDSQALAQGNLKRLKAATDFEKLVKGFALPESGTMTLSELVESNPGWGIARAMYVSALCELLHQTGDVDILRKAQEHMHVALLLNPGHPFVKSVELQLTTAQHLFSPQYVSPERLGEDIVDELQEQHDHYPFGNRMIAEYRLATGDYKAAYKSLERIINDFDSQFALNGYIPIAIAEDYAIRITEAKIPPMYYVYVDDPDQALRALKAPQWRDSVIARVWKPWILLVCGQEAEAKKAIEELQPLVEGHAWFVSNVIKLFSGTFDEADMERAAKGNRIQQTHHLVALASYVLTHSEDGGRERALEYLDRAIKLDCRTLAIYHWGIAFRKKLLEAPDWPESLKGKSE